MKSSKWMYGGHLTGGQLGSFIFLSCLYIVSSQTSNYIRPEKCTDEQIKKAKFDYIYYSLYISFTSRRNIRYIDYVQNNIETCQCRIRDQADCPRPRTFYQSFDPENPCCPKYNCICTGVTDGTNRYHKDQLAYYYGNCTIIQERFLVFKFKPLIIQTN